MSSITSQKSSESPLATKKEEKAKEVSTGNSNATTSTPANVTVPPGAAPAVPQIAPGSFLVTVDQLDPDAFENPRRAGNSPMPEDSINELRHSLKEQGQLQNIGVVPSPKNDGKYAVIYGWSRTEAATRNTYAPLIDKWNKEKGFDSTSPNYLVVNKPEHRATVRAAYAEEFAKEANKPHNKLFVKVDESVDATNKGDVYVKGIGENVTRKNMTLWQSINAIDNLVNNLGYKAKDAAKVLKISTTEVSLQRKIGRLPAALTRILTTPEEGETMTEADLVKLKEGVEKLTGELTRRLNLMNGDSEWVSYSHARELAGRVVKGDGEGEKDEDLKLTRVQILDRVAALVGANPKTFEFYGAKQIGGEGDSKTFKSTKSAENYTVWLTQIKTWEEENLKRKNAPAETPATSTEVAATPVAEGAVTGTVEGLAAAQASQVAAEANADAVVAPAPGTAATGTPAPVSTGNTVSTAAALVGGDGNLDDDLKEETGEKRTKVSSAPALETKVKDAHIIRGAVNTFLDSLREPEAEVGDKSLAQQAAWLGQVAFGYQMLNMDRDSLSFNTAMVEYCEQVEQYVLALENFSEAAMKKDKKLKFSAERPTLPAVVFEGVGPVEEFAGPDEEDEDGPSDEELAELGDDPGIDDLEEEGDSDE